MPVFFVRTHLLLLCLILAACAPETLTSSKARSEADCASTQTASDNDSCLKLHVPSPDWRDQIIYFAMIDRFADGDSSNNDQGAGVFDPSKESHYSGGDLAGLTENLDYIKNLGATAVWITPPVANMWWDPKVSYGGYHGYWARDFKSVDEHYGTLHDYKMLSHALHSQDMYLVQDIVVNHVGNYFSYHGDYDPTNPRKNFRLNPKALPAAAPSQPPFNKVDIFNDEHFAANIYNWTPEIRDFSDYLQETRYQTSSLSDLNTRNPEVIDALKESFSFWVTEVGVDGFRVDTAKYVETDFYDAFLFGPNGIYENAASTGRDNFFTFGEVYNTSPPYDDSGEKKLAKYVTSDALKSMDAAIGFPLYKEMQRVFASGAPTDYLKYRVEKQMSLFDKPFLQPNFIDNHDVERFLASADAEAFKLANVFMMTAPGIPMIYQGDEQLFTESRKAMFAGGYLNDEGSFDQTSPMYRFIQSLTKLRRGNKVFSRGDINFVQTSELAPGILFYSRTLKDDIAFVIINTANHRVILNADIGSQEWASEPKLVLAMNTEGALSSDWRGNIVGELPAMSAQVYLAAKASVTENSERTPAVESALNIAFQNAKTVFNNDEKVSFGGTSSLPEESLLVVLDGNVDTAKPITTQKNGDWSVSLDQRSLGKSLHSIELYSAASMTSSRQHRYTVIRDVPEYSSAKVDPAGDDTGPTNNYTKPLHDSVGCETDIRHAKAVAGGSVMELTLTMCNVSDMWAPSNMFDHVAFSIYFDIPQREGKKLLPLIGGSFPGDARWDFAHITYGWGNYLFSSEGASNTTEGTKLGIAPKITVDKETNTITFRYAGERLGITSWKDAKVYITTWDKDGTGNYRPLAEKATMWSFGYSGLKEGEPGVRIMDDVSLRLK